MILCAREGRGRRTAEVGCKLSYQTASPMLKARPMDLAQDQSPHSCPRRSQSASGRSSTPEAHPCPSTNLQGFGDHCPSCPVQAQPLHSPLWVLPAELHAGYRQPRAQQCEHKVWIWCSGLLNPPSCPCMHPTRAQRG